MFPMKKAGVIHIIFQFGDMQFEKSYVGQVLLSKSNQLGGGLFQKYKNTCPYIHIGSLVSSEVEYIEILSFLKVLYKVSHFYCSDFGVEYICLLVSTMPWSGLNIYNYDLQLSPLIHIELEGICCCC